MTGISQLFDLSGKTAIVTGGSRGLGAMIARGLVENGVKTYISSEQADECLAKAQELSDYGECIPMPGDFSTLAGIQAFANDFCAQERALNILVNNAGAGNGAALAEFTEADWDTVMDINLKAPFFLTQKLLEQLKASARADDPARIINIASIAGLSPPEKHLGFSYTSSKAGVINITKHLAMNLSPENITVNSISPGLFPTLLTGHKKDFTDVVDFSAIPRGRMGTPEDIVGAVVYLSSRAGAWLTGVNIPVDGGAVVKR